MTEVNIWSLPKDDSIKHLLLMLVTDSPNIASCMSADRISDNPKDVLLRDPANPELRAYVYTYGQKRDSYGVHLEYPSAIDVNYVDTLAVHENISYRHLLSLVTQHLNVEDVA